MRFLATNKLSWQKPHRTPLKASNAAMKKFLTRSVKLPSLLIFAVTGRYFHQLMEAEACGHVYMQPQQRYETAERVMASITKEDVNGIAKELCEHLSHMQPEKGVKPVALVACAPVQGRNGNCSPS